MTLSEIIRNKSDFLTAIIISCGCIAVVATAFIISPPFISDTQNPLIHSKETSLCNTQKICINHANAAELSLLVGIGKEKASAIVEYRRQNGFFTDIFGLSSVSCISEKIVSDNINNITV